MRKPIKITAHNAGWPSEFRFAVSVFWSGVCEFCRSAIMRIQRHIFPAFALGAWLCVAGQCVAAPKPTFTAAEQGVIDALLSQTQMSRVQVIKDVASIRELGWSNAEQQLDLLRNPPKGVEVIGDRSAAFTEALEDLLKKNKTDTKIVFPLKHAGRVKLVSNATINEIFSDEANRKWEGWNRFYRRFPDSGGLITISRVGIDSKSTVAIVYLGKGMGYLAGSGRIHILRLKGKTWVLTHEVIGPIWQS